MNKMLRQAIMKRSGLKNKANKTENHLDIRNCKKQGNIVVNFNKEAKLQCFSNVSAMVQQTQNLSGKIVNHIFLTNIVWSILILY